MSQPVNVQKLQQEAVERQVFDLFREPLVHGVTEEARKQIRRLIQLAQEESPDDPIQFLRNLDRSTPRAMQLGGASTRLGQVYLTAELYVKKQKRERERMREAIKPYIPSQKEASHE